MSKNEIMKNEKLKLEEIVGYLPYELKILFVSNRMVDRLSRNDIVTLKEIQEGIICVNGYKTNNKSYLPILHPLKEIQNHIHKFSDKLCTYGSNDKFGGIDSASPEDYQLMYKLHLDVYNLIGRGLAIDINTLNKQ